MYGTHLQFNSEDTVFNNSLMPSGIVIHEWKMMTDYVSDKTIPTLPILKRGQKYQFTFDYEVEPLGSIYFKLIFKRRNGTESGVQIIQQPDIEVTYPIDAFSYELQMINAAAKHVRFRTITIQEKADTSSASDLYVSSMVNEDSAIPVANIIVVEEQPLSYDAIRLFKNVIGIENWHYDDSPILKHQLVSLKQHYQLHFIGYHHKSNEMAYKLATLLGGVAFVTHHHDAGQPEFHLREGAPTVVYMYEQDEAPAHMKMVQNMLNPSRFLKYINEEILNGGKDDEI
ncbi:accessory Sec system protein Asp3 [Staphylococcus ratti]|uniref:Accessory Sec system protein Asp3 n=1 Tax=Staphylococcus ratti TaxID=2892440 RepID=A0ABY3PD60_9STAP|nr:accessory Sec system protein Asp3 [Staphylococcus ratti]UEX90233.1 accessory Sec system protein Asp3 [Staphylococcus ratti]